MSNVLVRHVSCAVLLMIIILLLGFSFILKAEVKNLEFIKYKKINFNKKALKNKFVNVSKVDLESNILRVASEQQVTIVKIPLIKDHRVYFVVKGSLVKLNSFISAINFLYMDGYSLKLADNGDLYLEIRSLFSTDYLPNNKNIINDKNLGNLFLVSTGAKKYEFSEGSYDSSLLNYTSIKQLRAVGSVVLNKTLWVLFEFPDSAVVMVKTGSFVGLEHAQILNEREVVVNGHRQSLFV